MLITEIRPAKAGKKKKYSIVLDDGTVFALYAKEVSAYELERLCEEHSELSPEIYKEILRNILIPRAKKRAMYLLQKMDYPEKQLRDKLLDSGYPPVVVDEAISYVKAYHYVDDERYAYAYVRTYQDKKSRYRILQELSQKGVDRELIQSALDEEYSVSEEEQMRLLLRKKFPDAFAARDDAGNGGDLFDDNENNAKSEREILADRRAKQQKQYQKMYRFLASRGFSPSDIYEVLRDAEC